MSSINRQLISFILLCSPILLFNGCVDLEIKSQDSEMLANDMTPDSDQSILRDSAQSMDSLLSEDMKFNDMTESTDIDPVSDMCDESNYELCDGVDNDCDGQIDEAHWEVEPGATGLSITFSPDTDLRDAQLTVAIKGSITRDQFTLDTLIDANAIAQERTYDFPEAFALKIDVIRGDDEAWSYQIEMVTDLTAERHQLPPPYPEVNQNTVEVHQIYALSNNLSAGTLCSQCPEPLFSECSDGVVICPGAVPTPVETCNNFDDDCDGSIDEALTMRCSTLGALGVCGAVDSICQEGEWSSCAFDDLKDRADRIGELIYEHEAGCDCYDNNCNGVVDEPSVYEHDTPVDQIFTDGHSCPVDLSRFTSPTYPPAQCHLRSNGLNDNGRPIPHKLYLDGTYYLDQLEIHPDAVVRVIRPRDSSGPGYVQDGLHQPCVDNDILSIGGNLKLIAQHIEIHPGALLDASSHMPHCNAASSSSNYQNYRGASGGNLWLFAETIDIQGRLVANGSTPTNSSAGYNCYNSFSGGAAGSIALVAPDIALDGAHIEARGGQGACLYGGMRCGRIAAWLNCPEGSDYSGSGPGGRGGLPYSQGDVGGAGSGGPNYRQVDPSRDLRVIGRIGPNTIATVSARDGNQVCDGHLLLSAGSLNLWSPGACSVTTPETFVQHHLTFMPLDNQGRPLVSDGLALEVHSVGAADTLIYSDPLSASRGALTLPISEVTAGSIYKLKAIVDDDQVNIASIKYIFQASNDDPAQVFDLTLDERGEVIFSVPTD